MRWLLCLISGVLCIASDDSRMHPRRLPPVLPEDVYSITRQMPPAVVHEVLREAASSGNVVGKVSLASLILLSGPGHAAAGGLEARELLREALGDPLLRGGRALAEDAGGDGGGLAEASQRHARALRFLPAAALLHLLLFGGCVPRYARMACVVGICAGAPALLHRLLPEHGRAFFAAAMLLSAFNAASLVHVANTSAAGPPAAQQVAAAGALALFARLWGSEAGRGAPWRRDLASLAAAGAGQAALGALPPAAAAAARQLIACALCAVLGSWLSAIGAFQFQLLPVTLSFPLLLLAQQPPPREILTATLLSGWLAAAALIHRRRRDPEPCSALLRSRLERLSDALRHGGARSERRRLRLRSDALFLQALSHIRGAPGDALAALEEADALGCPLRVEGRRLLALLLERLRPEEGRRARELLSACAKEGDAAAMNVLGCMMAAARGGDLDLRGAEAQWARASKMGRVDAMTNLGGLLCRAGYGPLERARGRALLEHAAKRGSREAMGQLGKALVSEARGSEEARRRMPEALMWLEQAARLGDHQAAVFLGLSLLRGENDMGCDQERGAAVLAQAAAAFEQEVRHLGILKDAEKGGASSSSSSGSSTSNSKEGNSHGNSNGITYGSNYGNNYGSNYGNSHGSSSVRFPQLSIAPLAAGRDSVVLFALCLLSGTGVPMAQKQAAEWLYLAASLDHPDACVILGEMHLRGEGAPTDAKAAATLFQQAARLGSPTGLTLLGRCYQTGDGIKANGKKAVQCFENAAHRGRADAQFLLAECYNNGDGVDYNHDAAVRWYREAARQGHAGAKRQLSDMGYFQDE